MIHKPGSSDLNDFTDVPGCIMRLKWSFGTYTVNPAVKSLCCIFHIFLSLLHTGKDKFNNPE
jgi:hypothetical protein